MATYVSPIRVGPGGRRCATLRADTPGQLAALAVALDVDLSAVVEPGTYRAAYELTEAERVDALLAGAKAVTFQEMAQHLSRWRSAEISRKLLVESLI